MSHQLNPALNNYIRGAKGPLGFNISELSIPLALYLSSPTTSTVLNTGTPATDGVGVDTWNSIAGGSVFAQATGAVQPLCKTNIKNGLQVVRFDGVAKTMTGNTASKAILNSKPGCTIVLAIGWTAYNAVAVTTPFGFTTTSGGSKVNIQTGFGTTTATRAIAARALAADTLSSIATTATYGTGWAVETYEVDFAGKQGRIRRNGTTEKNWTSFTNMTAGNAESGSSQNVYLGAFGAGAFANVDLMLGVVFPGILTSTELTNVERYIGGISGITVA